MGTEIPTSDGSGGPAGGPGVASGEATARRATLPLPSLVSWAIAGLAGAAIAFALTLDCSLHVGVERMASSLGGSASAGVMVGLARRGFHALVGET